MQGIGIAGFKKDHQELIFVTFPNAAAARGLLADLQPMIATAADVSAFNQLFSSISKRTGRELLEATWIGVLLSSHAYSTLGVSFSGLPPGEGTNAFQQGMAARGQQIGDVQPGDLSSGWLPAFQPANRVDALIVVASDDRDDLDEMVTSITELVTSAGCAIVFQEGGATLPDPLRGHEHFGFKDGISQPSIIAFDLPPDPSAPPAVAPGEFVLGYPTETSPTPLTVDSLWVNGSFAVFRRLTQDVAAFRAQVNTPIAGANPQLTSSQIGAALVGRWPSGAPLALNPTGDPGPAGITNDFEFQAADPNGQITPLFCHIRKANPRDEQTPDAANDNPKLHRMIRRGIPFGPPLPTGASADDGVVRGLHFISIVADVDQQFEFVERQWVNSPNFPTGVVVQSRSPYGPPPNQVPCGPDPVIGEFPAGSQCVLEQQSGNTPFALLSQLVHVTAGEYFFVPSITALGLLASGTTT